MLVRFLLTAVLAAGFAVAQGGRGGGGGGRGDEGGMSGVAGIAQARGLTRQETLLEKLKLNKEQKEEATRILSSAMEKAAPGRDLLAKGRINIANAITGKASQAELDQLMGEYTAATAKMTAVEAEAFSKLYALLKPNQQSKAPQVFELMEGMFSGGGPGFGTDGGMGRGRGGEGRGRGGQGWGEGGGGGRR